MTDLLIQGWRGISHSYAMVNQYQLLELMKRDDIALYHEDLPFYQSQWNPVTCTAGFDPERAAKIAAIAAPPPGFQPDVTFRIGFPLRFYGAEAGRVFVFGTAERQYLPADFIYQGPQAWQRYPNETVEIVTPSHWSKQGFLQYGFPESRIHVIAHGVDTAIFRPMPRDERQARRRALGLPEDSFIFLTLGAATTNKGLASLIRAFDAVHRRNRNTALLIKDSRFLYRINADDEVGSVIDRYRLNPTLRNAIGVIPSNLDLERMRELYCLADAYVSPYRYEGFNLPPLEAAACGLPVLVTEGGSTDDYAHPSFARKIAAKKFTDGPESRLEVELDSLIAGMEDFAGGRSGCDPKVALPWIAEHFSWRGATDKLAELFLSASR